MMAEFTVQDVAAQAGCSPSTVRKVIKLGKLQERRIPASTDNPRGLVFVVAPSLVNAANVVKELHPKSGIKRPRRQSSMGTAKITALVNRQDDFFALDDVAKALDKTTSTLYGFINRENIKTTKISGRAHVTRASVVRIRDYYTAKSTKAVTVNGSVTEVKADAGALAGVEKRLTSRINELAAQVESLTKMTAAVFQQLGGDVH